MRKKKDKSKILEKLHELKTIDTDNLRLYSAKIKISLFNYESNDLK